MKARAILLVGVSGIIVAGGMGCTPSGGPSPSQRRPASVGSLSGDLERDYLVGPEAARKLGLRIVFQSQTHPEQGSGIKRMSVQADAIFVLDGVNFLTRLRRANGQRLWRLPVAGRLALRCTMGCLESVHARASLMRSASSRPSRSARSM